MMRIRDIGSAPSTAETLGGYDDKNSSKDMLEKTKNRIKLVF
jgi:hypothetical protein